MNESYNKKSASQQRKAGFIIGLWLLPVIGIFAYFGQPQRGLVVACICGVFLVAIYLKGRAAKGPYAVLTLSILFAAQLFAAITVRIPSYHFPGIVMLPIVLVDLHFVLAILKAVGKEE